MHGETLEFDVSISNGNIKYLIGKSIFAVNLLLKLFCVTLANADMGSSKFLHTFLYPKQIFDAKLLIRRLPFFSVPKITVIRPSKQVKKFKNFHPD